jgi:hypothetical protein
MKYPGWGLDAYVFTTVFLYLAVKDPTGRIHGSQVHL